MANYKKKEGQLVGFEEFKKELESKYSTLRENFLLKLLEFWCNGKLFSDLRDIQMIKNDKGIFTNIVEENRCEYHR